MKKKNLRPGIRVHDNSIEAKNDDDDDGVQEMHSQRIEAHKPSSQRRVFQT